MTQKLTSKATEQEPKVFGDDAQPYLGHPIELRVMTEKQEHDHIYRPHMVLQALADLCLGTKSPTISASAEGMACLFLMLGDIINLDAVGYDTVAKLRKQAMVDEPKVTNQGSAP